MLSPPGRTTSARSTIEPLARIDVRMLRLDDQPDDACAARATSLLNDAGPGDPRASAARWPLVYAQLRGLAGRRMRRERRDQPVQATALVHEAYLRLVDVSKVQFWASRWH